MCLGFSQEALINVCVSAGDASIFSPPRKKRGKLGSDDTGSPQHLAAALGTGAKCVFTSVSVHIGNGPFECTGGDGTSVWEVFLFIYQEGDD